jgi:hypothetical protein
MKRACMVDYRELPLQRTLAPPVLPEYAASNLRKYHCTSNIFRNVCMYGIVFTFKVMDSALAARIMDLNAL